MTSKAELRTAFRALLETLPEYEGGHGEPSRQALDQRLVDRLIELLQHQSGTWAAFHPHGYEPKIMPALVQLERIDWVFPRVEGQHLAFYAPRVSRTELHEALVASRWGILEPAPEASRLVPLSEIRGFLVPGIAFDRDGRRLGRGRGYYDRALGSPELELNGPTATTGTTQAFKLGIAYDRQISDVEIPVEPFDVLMDGVLTDANYFGRRPNDEGTGRMQSERNGPWTQS